MSATIPAASARSRLITEIGLVLMALLWGLNFPVLKYGVEFLTPVVYNALRMSLGCVLLFILASRAAPTTTREDRLRLMALGLLGHCVYQLLFLQGVSLTRAGTASLIQAASPVTVALVATWRGHERLAWRSVLGIACSLLGVGLVLGGTALADGRAQLIGDLLVLLAVCCWAFYATGLVPYMRRIASLEIAAWTLLGGILPLIVLAVPGMLHTAWDGVPWLAWVCVVYSGVLAMVVAYLFYYRGVREVGPTLTSMFSNLQPIVAVLFAWLLLGEVPTLYQGMGAVAIIGGLFLAR